MRPRVGSVIWFIAGGLIGFSAIYPVGLGAVTLLPSLCVGALLLTFRVPGPAMALVGSGAVMATLWALHITSGDTPDSAIWPILLGLALIIAGITIIIRQSRRVARSRKS